MKTRIVGKKRGLPVRQTSLDELLSCLKLKKSRPFGLRVGLLFFESKESLRKSGFSGTFGGRKKTRSTF
jgi:hypothetical protein